MKRWPLRDVTRDKTADRSLGDKVHRATLYTVRKREGVVATMPEWRELRDRARAARLSALDRQDELYDRFTSSLQARGIHVHAAPTAAKAATLITELVEQAGSRVIKAKSMTTEEIGLNQVLQRAGITVTETDLGELIVQLAGQPPSHVTAPAIHLSTEDIARIFGEHLGMEVPGWARGDGSADEATRRELARELSLQARAHLRERFLEADVGISGANFLVAETGTVVLLENECNIQLTTSLPKRHIVLAGIDKLIESEADLAVLLQLLPVSATAQRQTCYVSLFADAHPDMHVVLLDGGRRELLRDPAMRDLLTCIRCGACLNACPVYRNVGGHAYGGAYGGPIGSLLMPHLGGTERYGELPFATPLCGACEEACPVGIPLPERFLELRARLVEQGMPDKLAVPLRAARLAMGRSGTMQLGARLYPVARRMARVTEAGRAWTDTRQLPAPARESFRSWWRRERAGPRHPSSQSRTRGERPERHERHERPERHEAPLPDPKVSEEMTGSRALGLQRFEQRLAQLGPDGETELHRFGDEAAALDFVGQQISAHPADAVLIEGEPPQKREFALGITSAALLIADTGGIVLDRADRFAARPATLVDTSLVVAHAEQLVTDLPAALAERARRRAKGQWHDLQILIAGPSRTADVEKVLVIPAHGPRRLIVVLCDEPVDLAKLHRSENDDP